MGVAVATFVALAVVIVAAGSVLTLCADAIAEITGLGRLLVGSVLLAVATSLPELTVGLGAIRLDMPNLAVGDLLGGCLMNLLILSIMDLSHRSRGKMLSRAAAAHALSGTLAIVLVALAGVGILAAPHLPEVTLLGMHPTVWLIAGGYALGVRVVYLDQRISARAVEESRSADGKPARRSLKVYAAAFSAAVATIVIIGPRLAHTAGTIAELSGLGNSFVGTTFVAVCTSLPELVASIVAIRIGALDLVVGNVFGSNAFNMVLFVPLDAAYPGALFAAASPAHAISVLAVVSCTSLAIMGQLYQRESRVRILEPDAWLIMAMIFGAFFLVYATA